MQRPADAVEQPLPRDRVIAHDVPLGLVQRAGLVEDVVGRRELADVVQQGAELHQPALLAVDVQLVGDDERELDDALAVRAGVLVLGAEHVSKQERRPAIGGAQLDRVIDALGSLVREDGQHPDERERQEVRVRLRHGRVRGQQPDRRQQQVDQPDFGHGARARLARRRGAGNHSRTMVPAVSQRELGHEREHVPAPVAEVGIAEVGELEDERRPERVPGVAEREQHALGMPASGHNRREAVDGVGARNRERNGGRRQDEQHRNEDELRRAHEARTKIEVQAPEHRQSEDEQDDVCDRDVVVPAKGHEQPGGHDEQHGDECLSRELATPYRLEAARASLLSLFERGRHFW